jgi:NAD(P)-dependent dehydrogenase (short-subunit alcohol dehydrogenase family)
LQNGPFDAIIYSVGVNRLDWLQDIDIRDMTAMYEINVGGLVRVLQACPEAKRVVVVGSDAAWRPMRTSLAYCASKAALEMAVKVIARERASDDFAINIVAPGMTNDTEMTKYVDERVLEVRGWSQSYAREYEASQRGNTRRAEPYEVAEVVLSTLTLDTPYLNGATIAVNGAR